MFPLSQKSLVAIHWLGERRSLSLSLMAKSIPEPRASHWNAFEARAVSDCVAHTATLDQVFSRARARKCALQEHSPSSSATVLPLEGIR